MHEACRILVVEDDEALAELLQEYLSESDYDITLHMRGDSAMEHLSRERFDLVLSDIALPGTDGLSILRHVVTNHAPEQTMVLLMTGYSGIDDALHAVEKGAYDFVSKPFRLPEIRVRLDNAARYQRMLRRWDYIQRKRANHVSVQIEESNGRQLHHVGDRTAVQAYIRNGVQGVLDPYAEDLDPYTEYSTDNGATWHQIDMADGDAGADRSRRQRGLGC